MHLTYEQCPFNLNHVESLYRNLPNVIPDGAWHELPTGRPYTLYRVHSERFFQAVFSKEDHVLLQEVLACDPPETQDDASWLLIREDADDPCYSITSVFTRTFGLARIHEEVNRWLTPFGLRYDSWEDGARGFADFAPLEPGAWADAIKRLSWLESINLEVNRSIEEKIAGFWGRYEDSLRFAGDQCQDPNELAELPDFGFPQGPKRRSVQRYS